MSMASPWSDPRASSPLRAPLASGAPAMRQRAREVLRIWNGDLLIAGRVKRPSEVLSLWIVPSSGDGTLSRGDKPYPLTDVTLGADFHRDFQTQLAAMALSRMGPIADDDARGQVLQAGLVDSTNKLASLLNNGSFKLPEYRAALSVILGDALLALGEQQGDLDRLEQAVDAYRAALNVYTRFSRRG